jgi:hypothetical protein
MPLAQAYPVATGPSVHGGDTIPGATRGGSEVQQSRRQSTVDIMTVALSKHKASLGRHILSIEEEPPGEG